MLKVLITEVETGEVHIDLECNAIIAGIADANNEGDVHGFTYAQKADAFVVAGCANAAERELSALFAKFPELERLAAHPKDARALVEMREDREEEDGPNE